MLQLLFLLALSWLLLWLFNKSDLSVLGLAPNKTRITYFAILFMVSALLAYSAFGLRMYFAKESYVLTPGLTVSSVLREIWFQFRTVLTEELLCRGAMLYILIKKIGPSKAIILSSLLFAMLHWLNAGLWGNLPQMMLVSAFTFAMGLLLAWAYAKSFSMLLPFAIHFGWNLIQNYIFPDSSAGNHMFIQAGPPPTVTLSYTAFLTMLLLPKVLVLLLNYFILKYYRQVEIP